MRRATAKKRHFNWGILHPDEPQSPRIQAVYDKWRRSGSNRQPRACKARALPIELRPRTNSPDAARSRLRRHRPGTVEVHPGGGANRHLKSDARGRLRRTLPHVRCKSTILWRLSTFARCAPDVPSPGFATLTRRAGRIERPWSPGHCGRTGGGTGAAAAAGMGSAGRGSAGLVPNRRLKTSGSNGSAGWVTASRGFVADLISPVGWRAVAAVVEIVSGGGPKGLRLGMATPAAATGVAAWGEAR